MLFRSSARPGGTPGGVAPGGAMGGGASQAQRRSLPNARDAANGTGNQGSGA